MEAEGPYFAFIHTYKVHSPYDPEGEARERFVRSYDGELPDFVHPPDFPWGHLTRETLSAADTRYVSDLYDAEVSELDTAVGGLLEQLERAGELENTLLVVTSDHGEEFNEHSHFGHGWSLYEDQLAVPLIMHFPGRFEGGLTASAPVIGIDLAPTIARAVGLPPHPSWSGVALSPENTIADRPMWVPYRTRHTGQAAVALRRDNAKLLDFPGDERPNDGNSGRQLYDLAVDGEERINRWEDDSVEAARWDRALTNLRLRYPLRFQGETVSTDEDVAEMLKGLGYGGDD